MVVSPLFTPLCCLLIPSLQDAQRVHRHQADQPRRHGLAGRQWQDIRGHVRQGQAPARMQHHLVRRVVHPADAPECRGGGPVQLGARGRRGRRREQPAQTEHGHRGVRRGRPGGARQGDRRGPLPGREGGAGPRGEEGGRHQVAPRLRCEWPPPPTRCAVSSKCHL